MAGEDTSRGAAARPDTGSPSTPWPFLEYRDDQDQRREVVLAPNAMRLTVGRGAEADLRLQDPEVSRLHAVLERIAGTWTVWDEGMSRNGTFVNDERVLGRRRLHDGDRVRMGRSIMTFRKPQHSLVQATWDGPLAGAQGGAPGQRIWTPGGSPRRTAFCCTE